MILHALLAAASWQTFIVLVAIVIMNIPWGIKVPLRYRLGNMCEITTNAYMTFTLVGGILGSKLAIAIALLTHCC